jgi:hypothetical protein
MEVDPEAKENNVLPKELLSLWPTLDSLLVLFPNILGEC